MPQTLPAATKAYAPSAKGRSSVTVSTPATGEGTAMKVRKLSSSCDFAFKIFFLSCFGTKKLYFIRSFIGVFETCDGSMSFFVLFS